jgi:5-methylcytosine-specific restriction endonuclease McrA
MPPKPRSKSSDRTAATATTSNIVTEKATIPKALREQVWVTYAGRVFQRRCLVPWCQNTMTVFDFHVGHDVPESHGGATDIGNLRPICARCNLSMGSQYTVQEWSKLSAPVKRTWWEWLTGCAKGKAAAPQ